MRLWCRLLRDNRFQVAPCYWHRAALISATSALNSYYAWREHRRFGRQVTDTAIDEPPVFILGHWRSGTTLLHNLFAQDSRFAYPNTYQVVNPGTFLTTEDVNTRRFARLLPERRPMDNMRQTFQSPQEDEIALLLMTLTSPYLGISFPDRESFYMQYLTLREASPQVVSRWKGALMAFVRKLTFKYRRPVVLKSPPHTARIRLLLQLFPDARFVHVCRNPYDVFQSSQHYFDTAVWYTYLQRPDRSIVDQGILDRYIALYQAMQEDLHRIPTGNFFQVRFEDLERQPVQTMDAIYRALRLPSFAVCRPRLEDYVSRHLKGYQKNVYPDLSLQWQNRIQQCWGEYFDLWNYPRGLDTVQPGNSVVARAV